jgi:hypothetical protein
MVPSQRSQRLQVNPASGAIQTFGTGRRKSGCTELAEGPERRFNRVANNLAPSTLSSRRRPGPRAALDTGLRRYDKPVR